MPPKKIILVESDEFYVEVIETFIKLFLQQQIIAVRDAHAAFAEIREGQPGLVLLDLESDGEASLDLAEKVRDDSKTKRIPILAISHNSSLRDDALGRGCSAFLTKPFRVRELETLITKLLDRA